MQILKAYMTYYLIEEVFIPQYSYIIYKKDLNNSFARKRQLE